MCIALICTSHPDYAIIVLDNRDEYVLRPTSRPHWWLHGPSEHQILSSRDLHRRERGTWMGMTEGGRLAVLTNFRETTQHDVAHPVMGVRSRGEMVTAWLGAAADENLPRFVEKMLKAGTLDGLGGFSMICGQLQRRDGGSIEPLAIISNRSEAVDDVPWIGGERGKVWGLSNTVYEEASTWDKVKMGEKLVEEAVKEAVRSGESEETLTERLFSVLDTNTLPLEDGMSFETCLHALRKSIFIPSILDEARRKDMDEAIDSGMFKTAFNEVEDESHETILQQRGNEAGFEKGAYGTQRQTLVLVDWKGNVTYKERALWDAHGNSIERGKGDVTHKFNIESWA